ncbi:beta-ketoacyl-ACP synthase III [Succiniclasticum ruminis]|uniref:Beta-ketoacyl-[acyl-carrier-protein] synthase III n=1 Tax=Succiniclasticum ruminis DSM 9236 TaxID=1123323 RepID=A0A1I1ZP41_9FIRM|nr:beta-ketoacyl-ACP synthase III [Succiniclasticum ruminis]SFE33466.1 3-oxoacyl-[acyl-carrier-protein] synthase III [Succiniclasticum ruminis DSM 9236]
MTFAAGIIGIGCYLPEKKLTNQDLEKMVDTSDAWITERTGIKTRHIAAPDQATSDLAYEASLQALADAKTKPEELDMIIVATETPDYKYPSTACLLQAKLGAKNAACFDLSAGCSGFVYALGIGSQSIVSGLYKKILLVGAETLSRIINWTDRNTCVLFGDGAGAAVLGRVDDGYGVLSLELGADGTGGEHLIQPAGGSRNPTTHETVDAYGQCVHMDGQDVFKFAARKMPAACKKVLQKAGMTIDDIALLVPHQANLRIIDNAIDRLKINRNRVWINIEKHGNMSAACVPVCLTEAQQAGRLKKGDNVIMVAFGAGLTWAGALLKWAK